MIGTHLAASCLFYTRILSTIPHTGAEAFHAYPQALKLSVASWMDAFVRLERLAADGPYSGQRLMRRSGISLLSMQTTPPIHATASTRHDGCSFNITAKLERVMCRFYQADYACLPYDLPRACRSSPSAEPELTSEISLGERAVSVAGAIAKGAGLEIPERSTVISGARTRAIGPSATTRTFEVGGVLYATLLET